MGRRDRDERYEAKYRFRGDADTFDTDMLGPGHVPDPVGEGREGRLYDSYNWGGRLTNSWERIPGRSDDEDD